MSLHVGEIGAAIECDMAEDVSTASTYTIFLARPDGTVIAKSATLVSGSTTKIQCVTASGDLTIAGKWKTQPKAVWTSGDVAYGDEADLHVRKTLG